MKKLLILSTIPLYLFTIISCNDSSSTTQSNVADTTMKDSTTKDTSKQLASAPPAPNISKYIIDSATAAEMIHHEPAFPHTPKKIDSSIKNEILLQYPNAVIYPIKAKYREEDVDRYTSTRGFQPNSDTGKVKNFKTVIYKVVISGTTTLTDVTTYYDFVTICPPPSSGDCSWVQKK